MQEKNLLEIDSPALGTDADTASLGTPEEKSESEQEAFRVFRTQEEFQECLDRALGKRLSKARAQSEELSRLRPILESAQAHFKVSSLEELESALSGFENAQAADENLAENSGELCDLQAQLAEALESELSSLAETELYGMQKAEDLISNERFLALLENGFTVKEALDALNFSTLLESEKQKMRSEVIREIRLRGLRPEEEAISGYGSFSAALDPRNLSDEQRAQIRERVRRGERVTF
ncbi:MAG: hypothetical protein UHH95_01405 [Oscillospiraceae bacterium]|nr:hypothetical protein [Oscillospiraceae bacterium]